MCWMLNIFECVRDLWDVPRGDVQEAACTRHLELQKGVDHRGACNCWYVDRRIYALWGWGGELGEMGPGAPVRSAHIEGTKIKKRHRARQEGPSERCERNSHAGGSRAGR